MMPNWEVNQNFYNNKCSVSNMIPIKKKKHMFLFFYSFQSLFVNSINMTGQIIVTRSLFVLFKTNIRVPNKRTINQNT